MPIAKVTKVKIPGSVAVTEENVARACVTAGAPIVHEIHAQRPGVADD